MDTDQKNTSEDNVGKPVVIPASEVAQNPNPRANENIRVRTEPPKENKESSKSLGSEITDGEDA
jgi:hypothetical protein